MPENSTFCCRAPTRPMPRQPPPQTRRSAGKGPAPNPTRKFRSQRDNASRPDFSLQIVRHTTAGCGQFRPAVVLYRQAHHRVNRNDALLQSTCCAFNHCTLRSGKSVQTSSTSAWLNNASCSAATEGQFFGRSSLLTTPVTTRSPAA